MSQTIASTSPSASRVRRRVSLAVAFAVACAAAAAIALGGGSSSGGLGPAAAIADAAQQTAQVASGVAQATITAGDRTQSTVVRFDGDDAEVAFDQVDAEGDTVQRVIRAVDGRGYEQVDGGAWRALDSQAEGDLLQSLRADIGNGGLVDAVRSASGVTQDGDVYRAQFDGGLALDNTLLGLTTGAPLAEGTEVEVVAGEDGLLRRVTIRSTGVQRTVTYSELGAPQDITAPDVAAP